MVITQEHLDTAQKEVRLVIRQEALLWFLKKDSTYLMHVIFKMVKNIHTFDLCLQTQTPPPPQKKKLDFLKINYC